MAQPINLQYATPVSFAATRETPFKVFDIRGNVGWKGDRLFRVYLQSDRIYFIKIGNSRRQGIAVGGLLGMIANRVSRHFNKKKTEKMLSQIALADPQTLLGGAKENFTLEYHEFNAPIIRARTFFSVMDGVGKLTFVNGKGKKRTYTFDDVSAMQAAVKYVGERFGATATKWVMWNEKKKKFVKAQP